MSLFGPSAGRGATNIVRISVDSAEVRRTLSQLPQKLNERVRKKAIREGTKPYIGKLRTAWRGARYQGKGLHRRAIAASTRLDGPKRAQKGYGALIFSIGVDYRAKRGKGRQRIWHLLESGCRHKGAKRRIPGSFISMRWARSNATAMGNAIAEAILRQASLVMGGLRRAA